MAIVKVQYKRPFASHPVVGKWYCYSTAWFSVTGATTLDATMLTNMQRLFLNLTSAGAVGIAGTTYADTSANAAQISTWLWSAGDLSHLADYNVTVPVVGSGLTGLAMQTVVALGYRNIAQGATVRQRGRSRLFIQASYVPAGSLTGSNNSLRLTSAAVDVAVANFKQMRDVLNTANWRLTVKTGIPAVATFHDADECYADDVFDVMRTRRPWQIYQKRQAI